MKRRVAIIAATVLTLLVLAAMAAGADTAVALRPTQGHHHHGTFRDGFHAWLISPPKTGVVP